MPLARPTYVQAQPNPVVELNRGVAHWKAFGTESARLIVEPLLDDPRMKGYHLLHAVLAELDVADGNLERAAERLRSALTMTESAADRTVLSKKLAALEAP